MEFFISTFVKMFFIMTPFFVLSVFMSLTEHATEKERKALAIKVTRAIIIICLVILFFGKHIFAVFGITLDAFKIGAGAILFLTAIDLVRGTKEDAKENTKSLSEIAVVPLAMPITIGPGTIGVLLVFGVSYKSTAELITITLALISAILLIGAMLYTSNFIQRVIGKQGLLVMSKITGLILAGLSAQLIFEGIKSMLNL
ncbi:MAG: MarC family protein [Campylobacteraceae bacterium]|nr:MarC family protein [Campylobacteraceae bacterium]